MRARVFCLLALVYVQESVGRRQSSYLNQLDLESEVVGLQVSTVSKKGIGLKSIYGGSQLAALNVTWYYNWGSKANADAAATSQVPFVPMVFSRNALSKLPSSPPLGPIVLGFNEPDNDSQANLTVKEALDLWPRVAALGTLVGSPATAKNPATTWLPDFMAAKPKVDFVTVHWYKGVSASLFKSDIKGIMATFGLPVWITEFAPQTTSSSQANATKFSQAQVNAFINDVVPWMEQEPMVQRYAWHCSAVGTSAIFAPDGRLTDTGRAYAAAR